MSKEGSDGDNDRQDECNGHDHNYSYAAPLPNSIPHGRACHGTIGLRMRSTKASGKDRG